MSSSVNYHLLQPAYFGLDGGAMFGIIPRPMWQKVAPPDELNRIDLALRLWLIQTDNKNILVDAGIGDYHGEKFNQQFNVTKGESPLNQCLSELNLKPEDITDFVISHLHFDHVGGMVSKEGDQFVPLLPKATCHLHKDHFEYAGKPSLRDRGSFHHKCFMPAIEHYQSNGQLNLHEGDSGLLIKDGDYELKFRVSHGHTPYLMHPYDQNLIYMADLIPTSNHVHIPWVMGYDIEPAVTTKFKEDFLSFIEENSLTVIYEHDPKFWGSKIQRGEKGFKPNELKEAHRERFIKLDL